MDRIKNPNEIKYLKVPTYEESIVRGICVRSIPAR
jgi:hypothetical protein